MPIIHRSVDIGCVHPPRPPLPLLPSPSKTTRPVSSFYHLRQCIAYKIHPFKEDNGFKLYALYMRHTLSERASERASVCAVTVFNFEKGIALVPSILRVCPAIFHRFSYCREMPMPMPLSLCMLGLLMMLAVQCNSAPNISYAQKPSLTIKVFPWHFFPFFLRDHCFLFLFHIYRF